MSQESFICKDILNGLILTVISTQNEIKDVIRTAFGQIAELREDGEDERDENSKEELEARLVTLRQALKMLFEVLTSNFVAKVMLDVFGTWAVMGLVADVASTGFLGSLKTLFEVLISNALKKSTNVIFSSASASKGLVEDAL
ncbi:hypothetical protein BCV72DRAFT_310647 [Rhizopus microsporus var. microsporus]|uniref:Uncharacterized protein n=2 Tax=Rhizopus microsporus TaxID=58291 RepID=A0A2G4SPL6_RHIZD|nr:uncharacterized protein RHIMIDRAFT_239533 [Rhizopus microsporus ATCC 52813]ORE00781.1 hypothetical protein BCV72DRAFT_310647 [Rhizopus microsporus var. microsporus]PHZ10711.1 hypothetical protein RHIMIDRAFT_239533 [Rhizopus microsporus ATCC 52813]